MATALHREILKGILRLGREESWQVDTAVAEKPLAERLGVSRTPVRRALIDLEAQGLLRREIGKGFILNREIVEPLTVVTPKPAEAELFERILADRIGGKISDEISENALISRYQVARGDLRKALMRLSADGIIHRQRGHGWRFGESLDTPKAIAESYAFREAIETAALQQPDYRVDQAALARLRASHESMMKLAPGEISRDTWFYVNASFHETLAAWSQNRFFIQAVKRQNALRQMHQFADFGQLSPQQVLESCRDHLAILDALEAGRRTEAVRLLAEHLRHAAIDWENEVAGLGKG